MKKLFIFLFALVNSACTMQTHVPSWQPSLSIEEGVTMYYWDTPQIDSDNQNFMSTRILAHGSSYGPSLVLDVTFNCSSEIPSMRLNQVEVYSEEFAQGALQGKMMDKPDGWENISSPDRDFQDVYQKTCKVIN